MDYMIEVLMLLAVFATNILKPISKVLEDYDGLMSLVELIVEGLFLFFVLKEFKMTRQDFEWTRKDRREEKTKRELCYFGWCLAYDFAKTAKKAINEGIDLSTLLNSKSEEVVENWFVSRAQRYSLPVSFCKKFINLSIKQLKDQLPATEPVKAKNIYEYFFKLADDLGTNKDTLGPAFINQIRHKYFNSDEEIDEIYEKLTNNKL